ncbi:hypothetical protein BVG16_13250 [Paenibacillus selenitireducens]|uniref:Chloramphenicol phosphotransferase n=1 Tax=Paenibacillus selenitireducens TaxID=1324314 RepID=A0A1T2XC04_9BACL|nr:AAA family ATPase [Paenibacillus selenitireducens]OPA77421.1 hypothetical protein BVG16_13250 [Paenibacillus selenitireducens]
MRQGTVIFLNGTSSAGKTSISQALLQTCEEDFMYVSVDHAIAGVNEMLLRMYGEHVSVDEIRSIENDETIEPPVISLFHHTIKAFSMLGKNVIVDHVLVESGWAAECAQLLHETPAFLIGVRCPLDEMERRERDRGDRPVGLARAQWDIVHQHRTYDLEVNTHTNSIHACAKLITEYVRQHQPVAFKELYAAALAHKKIL